MEYLFYKPKSEEDYEALYKMTDASFEDEDVRGITRRFVENHPDMGNENFFMVKKGDEVAAGLLLLPQTWIIGGVEIKVAEMGCVGTRTEHRRKRLQEILNDKFDSYAKENGYDLCALAGIPYFYRQFGYQYAIELNFSAEIDAKKIPDTEPVLQRREITESDTPKMDTILRSTQQRYFVKSTRTNGVWKMQQDTGTYGAEPFEGVALTKGGDPVGYYRYAVDSKNSTLYIRELGFSENASVGEVISTLKKHVEETGLKKIKTGLSSVDPINLRLMELGATGNEPYAWQIKPIDLFSFMAKMKPAFEKRIEESQFKGLNKELAFNFFKFAVKMVIVDGKIQKMEKYYGEESRNLGFNPYAFIQMLVGYKGWREMAGAYPDFWVRDGLDDLVDVMFPKGVGYIHYTY
jgi:predicted acetyltransferase